MNAKTLAPLIWLLAISIVWASELPPDPHALTCGVNGPCLAPPVPIVGEKKLLFLRVTFPDDPSEPISEAEAEATLQETKAGFAATSFGKLSLRWTITPLMALTESKEHYASAGPNALIADGQRAAEAAGYKLADFDYDLIRHTPVAGFMGGYGLLGQRGALAQVGGAVVIMHELGHNFGLHHANFWNTDQRPARATKGFPSPPFPSNIDDIADRASVPFSPGSLVPNETIIGAGGSVEYGDPFDVMGGGQEPWQFNAAYKAYLGWLPETHVAQVQQDATIRLHGIDSAKLEANRMMALRIPSPTGGFAYWAQFRGQFNATDPRGLGLRVHRSDDGASVAQTLLLDMTPNTPAGPLDSPLPLGQTFHDPAGVFITPLAVGGDEGDRWMDVAVRLGKFAGKQKPTLKLESGATAVAPGQEVQLSATANDPDDATLAYHWDLGDGSPSRNTNALRHSWARAGEYVVRCIVSDLRGGQAFRHVLIRVGNPATRRISGRVLGSDGQPRAGAFVYAVSPDEEPGQARYVHAYADEDGRFVLAGLEPAVFHVYARLPGHRQESDSAPINLATANADDGSLLLTTIPSVAVTAKALAVEGDTVPFVFRREGSLDQPLSLNFSLTGTAEAGRDYARMFIRQVSFPKGVAESEIPLITFDDGQVEVPESVTLTLEAPQAGRRVDANGKEYTLHYPGWELRHSNGIATWFETKPDIILGPSSATTLMIRDQSSTPPSLSVLPGAQALELRGQRGLRYRVEQTADLRSWATFWTGELGAESLRIPLDPDQGGRRFFRAREP